MSNSYINLSECALWVLLIRDLIYFVTFYFLIVNISLQHVPHWITMHNTLKRKCLHGYCLTVESRLTGFPNSHSVWVPLWLSSHRTCDWDDKKPNHNQSNFITRRKQRTSRSLLLFIYETLCTALGVKNTLFHSIFFYVWWLLKNVVNNVLFTRMPSCSTRTAYISPLGDIQKP